jgi:predicted O-methyltransferase YrrM
LKTRALIQRICREPVRSYLEVGVLHGATLCSAIAGNPGLRAVGIDDFSQFDGKASDTLRNLGRFGRADLLIGDAFDFRPDRLGKFDLFFYDGDHSAAATAQAVQHFRAALEEPALLLVDDYDWPEVQEGVRAGLEEAELPLQWSWHLPAEQPSDALGWWNGLFVAVVG